MRMLTRPLAGVVALVVASTLVAAGVPARAATRHSYNVVAADPAVVPPVVPAAGNGADPPSHPNILFVLTDDLDRTELAVMPNVSTLLADQGVSFNNYFVSVSLCCPSRSTTLRGQYSHNTGVETNGGTNGGFETAHRLGLERSTIATWLHKAGYRTALVGKYLNGYPNTATLPYRVLLVVQWDSPTVGGNPYAEFDYTLNENGNLVHYGSEPRDYGTDVYTEKTIGFIDQAAADHKPFFAYLATYAPHQPATPAPRDKQLFPGVHAPRTASYDEADVSGKPAFIRSLPKMDPATVAAVDRLYRRRIQSLQAVDDAVGELVDALDRNGQLDNTYIVFTSDNGFHLGQHRMPAGKQPAYEEDIHVPLIVRGPGIPAGSTDSASPTMSPRACRPAYVPRRSSTDAPSPASWVSGRRDRARVRPTSSSTGRRSVAPVPGAARRSSRRTRIRDRRRR